MTVPLASFFFGVAFVFFGVVINAEMSGYETGLGVILVLGVFFLIIAFVSRQVVKNLPLPNASTCLALFVLFEFIAGTGMFLSLIVNVAVDSQEVGVAFYVLSVFGLLLVADSLLFYQRNFKKNPHS
jgi:xanthine/uracil/vitamin C permease (AzgA family)